MAEKKHKKQNSPQNPGISSKTKGPGNHPEISSQKLANFECRFPYDSYGRDRSHFGPFQEKDFGATSGGPLFSRPLCFIADWTIPYKFCLCVFSSFVFSLP